MKIRWFIIAVLFPLFALSQEQKPNARIHAIGSVGFAGGASTAKPLYQLVGGLSYGRAFSGIGFGLDQYKFNSFPLFADLRWSFGRTQTGYLYGNFGYNFADKKQDVIEEQPWISTHKIYGGFFADAGIGFRLRMSRLHQMLFSAGYSQKNMREELRYDGWCLIGPCPQQKLASRYQLGRIVAKMSWQFGR
jgi:hypothetical protein